MAQLEKWVRLQTNIPGLDSVAMDQEKLLRHMLVILTELGEELSTLNANIADIANKL